MMTLFGHPLDCIRVIIVTGPQRAGTTIAARIIAAESEMRYVDEDEYGTKDLAAWKKLVATGQRLVIQSPAMARWVHEVATDDVMVIWVVRPLADILRSQKRIGWHDGDERGKYKGVEGYLDEAPIAQIKTRYWRTFQMGQIPHAMEIDYHSLETHPLWREERDGWGKRQWQ